MKKLAAQGVEMTVLAVDYPKAPEHPYPAALNAAVEAYQWLVDQSGNTDDIIIGKHCQHGNNLVC